MLSKNILETARVFKKSTAPARSTTPSKRVFSGDTGHAIKALKTPVSSCKSRTTFKCSNLWRKDSPIPNVIVADEYIPNFLSALITSVHSSTVHLFPQSSLRISGTSKSAAPGTESIPAFSSLHTHSSRPTPAPRANQTISEGEKACSQSDGNAFFMRLRSLSAHSNVKSGCNPPCSIIWTAPRAAASEHKSKISSSDILNGATFPAFAW